MQTLRCCATWNDCLTIKKTESGDIYSMAEHRILVLGRGGQIGWELQRTLMPIGSVIAYGHNEIDLANAASLQRVIQEVKPQVIVNAAAYTAVDRAEQEPEQAHAVNAMAPGVLAEEAKRLHALLVHFSTDYVYDGSKGAPYVETDATGPLGVYGQTKLEGERAIEEVGGAYIILRTSWVYGSRGKNFLLTMLRLARERDILRVVSDQIGCPTWSRWAAEMTAQIVGRVIEQGGEDGRYTGVYHLSGGGSTSWHGFASAIVDLASRWPGFALRARSVEPISTAEYPTPAMRPQDTRLSTDKIRDTFGLAITPWERQLELCMAELQERYSP